MMKEDSAYTLNEKELMEYYGYNDAFGKTKLKLRYLRSWILHSFAYSSPHSGFSIYWQRVRGVKIGKNCHFCPYVLIDLIYPELVQIDDSVTIGSNAMIFAHSNPTANLFLKKGEYPRKIEQVHLKSGSVVNPGCIITAGVSVGENSIISPGSVVTQDIPDYCVAIGNPARVIKKINH